jgi:hypothetical protein
MEIKEENKQFEKQVFWKVYGPMYDHENWRREHNMECRDLYNSAHIVE